MAAVATCPRCGRNAVVDASAAQASCLSCQSTWSLAPPPLPINLNAPVAARKRNAPAKSMAASAVFFSLLGIGGLALCILLVLREGFHIGPDVRQIVPDHILVPDVLPRPAFTLSDEQQAVRDEIMKKANKPESVWFEKWYPAVVIPKEEYIINYRHRTANKVVHVIYRQTVPLFGEMRYNALYYLNDKQYVKWVARSSDDDFDETVKRYYGKNH